MSSMRLKWFGAKNFEAAEWKLWNRKNDVKEANGLRFARVFGRGWQFWDHNTIECSKFISKYILKKVPTKSELKSIKHPSLTLKDHMKKQNKEDSDNEKIH